MSRFEFPDMIQHIERPVSPERLAVETKITLGWSRQGFTREMLELFGPKMTFTEMGFAEFEHSMIPMAIYNMRQNASGQNAVPYFADNITIDVAPDRELVRKKLFLPHPKQQDVWVLCPKEFTGDVRDFIQDQATDAPAQIKVPTGFQRACFRQEIEALPNSSRRDIGVTGTVGWFDMINGVFFTTDYDMFASWAALIGLPDHQLAAVAAMRPEPVSPPQASDTTPPPRYEQLQLL